MAEFIGCWIVVSIAGLAWINYEMLVADLGPLYDENYRPIAGT